MRLTKDQLKIAPALPRMPARWSLELQKAVFHLAHSEFGNNACRSVCFSGLQRGGGNSTISYLIAHYLAAESSGLRVLFLDFSLDGRRAATQGVDGVFRIGETVPVDFLRANTNAFARYSIRPGDENSGINCSRWFRELMAICKQHCDWIIVDTPPFFSSPESYPVAQVCDGTVLVLKSGETRYPALNGLVGDLEQMGIRTLGTIMNFRQYPVPRWLLKYI
jgi:Mrp family chromosome partitioning ATPase